MSRRLDSRFACTLPLPPADGFTLLEVLVALVILAVALAAASRASHMATDSTLIMKQRLLAGWVAENRLAERRATQAWPQSGVAEGQAAQAGLDFTWQETVASTPNPAFRRIEVKVFGGEDKSYALATLVGYLRGP